MFLFQAICYFSRTVIWTQLANYNSQIYTDDQIHHPFDISVPCWSLSLTPTTCQAISLPFDLLIFHSFTLTPSMAKPFNNISNCMATSSEVSNCPPSGLASSTCWFLSYKLSYMSQQEYSTSCYLNAGIVLRLESLLKSGSTLACCCLAYDGCHQGCSDI